MFKFQFYIIFVFSVFSCFSAIGQDIDDVYRIEHYKFICPSEDVSIHELYDIGIRALNSDEHTSLAGKAFYQIIQKDKHLCDAYFFTGVALTRQDKHKAAVSYYYYADSLANGISDKFKEELAESALRVSNIGLARKKYEELVITFPEKPSGYYGIGLTSTSIGDYELGISNLILAEEKYIQNNTWTLQRKSEVNLIRGILYTQLQQYKNAVESFELSEEMFGELTDYLANYAWSTYNLFLLTRKNQYKEQCINTLIKLKNRKEIKQDFLDKFQFSE
ncbi:hypothetical protein [Myroides pelagicus]|uniref:Tetratricopeptide repeat protein n=1 Tax=Myroides pelagicus TaxID=270914 RepID=A0A7K1GQA6_9FLAO|nr:hypothetical protein [Myroides pelagicus]MTH31047.1 hypothetical protein [Myroides pelagicus]